MSGLIFTPIIPVFWIILLSLLGGMIAILFIWRAPLGGLLRLAAMGLLLALLAQPQWRHEDRTPEPDVVLIVRDRSASQQLDQRDRISVSAVAQLGERLSRLPNVEWRDVQIDGVQETRLGDGLRLALSDVPRARLAGVFVISDGRSADPLPDAQSLGLDAPVHLLLSGRDDEIDRHIEIISAPRYGVVRETAQIKLRIVDEGASGELAIATLRLNGEQVARQQVSVGEELSLSVPLEAPGKAIIDISVSPIDGELTLRNNRALIPISIIRDRLRVLLVSGEPHAGERVWRNLLKSDPAVDLVHFTILKPFDKEQRAAPSELALIPFPEDDLFLRKLSRFDVLIFDRYTYRNVLNQVHFDAISTYVHNGGAVLIAAGPELAQPGSLSDQRNLADILPAEPIAPPIEQAYLPSLTKAGARHPVTATLDGATEPAAAWGRWLRILPARVDHGDVLMRGAGNSPLLVLSHEGKGRVAMLLSDHIWLWARGFDGGGPHREFLRRLVHWLMKEPQLEEEALRLEITGQNDGAAQGRLTIIRQTMGEDVPSVRLLSPDGQDENIILKEEKPGLWVATKPVDEPGFYEAYTRGRGDQALYAVAAYGLQAPPEFAAITQTGAAFDELRAQTGGGEYHLRQNLQNGDRAIVPLIRQLDPGSRMSPARPNGPWAGIARKQASSLDRVSLRPLLPPAVWLGLLMAFLAGIWLFEGRRR